MEQQSTSSPAVSKCPFWHRKFTYCVLLVIILGATFYTGLSVGNSWGQTSVPTPFKAILGETKQVNPGYGEVQDTEKIPAYLSKDVNFKLFWDVWQLVQKESVNKDTPDIKLFYGALSGIVGALGDPYSVYFDPETYKKFN
ncbi:MAG: hypothetical protein AAB870_02825, partial [Patescibacteria group bacterium]